MMIQEYTRAGVASMQTSPSGEEQIGVVHALDPSTVIPEKPQPDGQIQIQGPQQTIIDTHRYRHLFGS